MNYRFVAFAVALAMSLTYVGSSFSRTMTSPYVVSGFSPTVTWSGQARSAAGKPQALLRTPDGQPDLQGIWTNSTITPLERPRELAGKEFFTEKEAAEYEKQMRERNNGDRRDSNAEADLTVGYNDVWWDRGTRVVSTRRTSIIVDPPDGRIPPLTPDAQKKEAARAEARRLAHIRSPAPRRDRESSKYSAVAAGSRSSTGRRRTGGSAGHRGHSSKVIKRRSRRPGTRTDTVRS